MKPGPASKVVDPPTQPASMSAPKSNEFPKETVATTGPLGQGFATAIGMALGQKMMAAAFGVEQEGRLNKDVHEVGASPLV